MVGKAWQYTVILAGGSQQKMWQGHKLSMSTSRNTSSSKTAPAEGSELPKQHHHWGP